MGGESVDRPGSPTARWRPSLRRWIDRRVDQAREGPLYPYRPRFASQHFWAVQGLILLVAGIHSAIEATGLLDHAPAEIDYSLTFVPVALFFIPVVYAALNFGLAGSVATAAWCSALAVPNVLFYHNGLQRVAEIFQLGIVDVIAVFVGQRVDRELGARRRAEVAGIALRASETKYRGLFESSPIAILVLDLDGLVLEANPAGGALFGRPPDSLRGAAVADLVGAEGAEKLLAPPLAGEQRGTHVTLRRSAEPDIYLQPYLTPISDSQGKPAIQVLLRDVTAELQRQAGLRAYAAHILQIQEDERKRVARELHDETIQNLILLCRQLDLAERGGTQRAPAVGRLHEARKTAEEVVRGLRDFAQALRPPTLDDLGLVTSVRRVLGDLAERAGVEGELRVAGEERRLPPDVELALFRIAQEALRNVERHGRATRVSVTVGFHTGGASLEVLDDGAGFALTPGVDLAASGHLGLLGMRERAESLGGRLEIQSEPGCGTTVAVSMPEKDGASEPPGMASTRSADAL